jgi:uncharacterized protein YjbJ (UPF0337 family)
MSEYNDWMAKKYGGGFSPYENPLPIGAGDNIPDEDLSGSIEKGVVESGKISPQQMAISPTQNPSAASGAGSKVMAAGAMTGQPELMAAGLALQTMGGIQDRAQQQRNASYQAEVAKINARQQAIARMAQIGAGLKA